MLCSRPGRPETTILSGRPAIPPPQFVPPPHELGAGSSQPSTVSPFFSSLFACSIGPWFLFAGGRPVMEFIDRLLTCTDCGREFIFTAGEQLFFFDKQFKNDPKRCKPCKSRRSGASVGAGPASAGISRTETRTTCSICAVETTVPFKPTQGRPVLCRQCFQQQGRAATPGTGVPVELVAAAEQAGTHELRKPQEVSGGPEAENEPMQV